MSKSKTSSTVKESTAVKSKALATLTQIFKAARNNKVMLVLTALLAIPFFLSGSTMLGHGSFAMLYLIANNGKLSGRADGNVYQRNGRVRKFVVPALVQNAYTSAARGLLGAISSAWNTLSQSERDSWLSMNWLFTSNRFGEKIPVKGKAAFVTLNANLFNAGGSPITNAPIDGGSIPTIGVISSFVPDQSSGSQTITFTPTPTDVDTAYLIYATAPLRAGVARPSKGLFKLIEVVAPATASPVDIAANYINRFGNNWSTDPLLQGANIWCKATPVNINTGAMNTSYVFSGTIVP